MKVFTDVIKDAQLIEITTKYGRYRIYEEKNGGLDVLKLEPLNADEPMIIKPIVSN